MIFYQGVESVKDIFSLNSIVPIAIISLLMSLFFVPLAKKYLQIMQQSSYQLGGYVKWLKRRPNFFNMRLVVLGLLSLLSYALITVAFVFVKKDYVSFIAFLPFVFFALLYMRGDKKHKDKCPLVVTARVKRLAVCFAILSLIVLFGVLLAINLLCYMWRYNAVICSVRLGLVLLVTALIPYLLFVANALMKPIEKQIAKKFINKAKDKLENNQGLIKIAVTGSYGKTSVKNVLAEILSVKYKVFATPLSYNTPLGICKAVEKLDETHEIFIAEMGARHIHDIEELCEIVRPNFGVITGICAQHLETFKSVDNIVKTKFELASFLSGQPLVVSADSELAYENAKKQNYQNVLYAGINKELASVYAENIEVGAFGCKFDLVCGGDRAEVCIPLLGKHNITNICLAAAIALKLGLTLSEIAEGASKLKPVEHRLEIVPSSTGVTVIDDSYNANEVGINAAIDALKSFDGRKIVVTPGLVEMGAREAAANREFGKKLAFADYVILVGTRSAYNVRDGLFEAEYNFDNVFMAKTLEDAKDKLKKICASGDVVLFENDLPDRFL